MDKFNNQRDKKTNKARKKIYKLSHTAKGLRGGSAVEVLRLPERTRETDPYRRPLNLSDGSATKADRGSAVAPCCIHSGPAIKTLPPWRVRLGPANVYRHPPRNRNGLIKILAHLARVRFGPVYLIFKIPSVLAVG
jgi:hypothetical protein